jgi:hypothetical protein
METKYWHCIIGPIDNDDLKWGADAPLRQAVLTRFKEQHGVSAPRCFSGWRDSEITDIIARIGLLTSTDPTGETRAKIKELLDANSKRFSDLMRDPDTE